MWESYEGDQALAYETLDLLEIKWRNILEIMFYCNNKGWNDY